MATTTYPKKYILERIAARKGSLERKLKEAGAFFDELERGSEEAIDNNASEILERIYHVEKLAKKVRNVVGSSDRKELMRLYRDMMSSANTLASSKGGDEFELVFERDQIARGIGYNDPRREKAFEAKKTLERVPGEIAGIEHVEAYLTETPVDEFTLTALKQLGLLEVIRFDLTSTQEARR